jgi:hypothetical protein
MMATELQGLATYGGGIFWKYLQSQFDFNNQVMRRTIDILSSETAGPLLKANDFPFPYFATINNTGGSAALDQAFKELFSKNIKDVWNDFSISLVLLRNNTAIPSKYRTLFPFWIYNTNYFGYPQLLSNMTAIGIPQFANWWEVMDTNGTIPANWNTPYTGQTFVRTLTGPIVGNVKNLMTLSFNVPHNTKSIKIDVASGEWRLTIVQFTSDGTSVGSWIQDGSYTVLGGGSYTFDIATHVPSYTPTGNIRLVCANVNFPDAASNPGTHLADYFSPEPNTGSITITPTF